MPQRGDQPTYAELRSRIFAAADSAPVVVGYTRSAAGDAALRMAAREARSRGTRLTIVRAATDIAPGLTPANGLVGMERDAAIAQLLDLAGHAKSGLKIIDVRVAHEPLADALLDASDNAALLVVGIAASALPTVATIDLTSRRVIDQARCPVLVVPEGTPDQPPKAIVCGVARSAAAVGALQWASCAARRIGVNLLAVHAPTGNSRGRAPGGISWHAWARRQVPVEPAVECADAPTDTANRLIDIAASEQALLVVGAHPHGEAAERAFVHVVTSQTRVPVVVVGDQSRASEAAPARTS
ncbi:MAG TPA: universal stress protein [Mycobacteriales bacterium]|nr:universal stress protein [Mycobacteriales bacterium]